VSEQARLGATPDRAADRERPGRPRWMVRAAVALGSVLLLGSGVLGFLRSPYFAAEHISVQGATRLSAERVLRIGGVERGQNVVTFDTAATEDRLESDPWIASATVTTDLPDTIVVRVTERVPVAAVQTHLGWEVVAADGVVLATPVKEPSLPAITSVVPGGDIVALAARSLAAMDRRLRADVSSLTIGVDGLARLVMNDGVTVSYGTLDEQAAKAQALAAVLEWAEEQAANVEQIDVSVPGAPTARLADGALATP
jgi:cell division protein FtsQ